MTDSALPPNDGNGRKNLGETMAGILAPRISVGDIEAEVLDVMRLHRRSHGVPCLAVSRPASIGKTRLLRRLIQEFRVVPNGWHPPKA